MSQHAYTPSQEEVQAVKAELSPADAAACDDTTAHRFLRAEKGNKKRAAARLTETLEWRRVEQPERVVCNACARDCRSHYMHPVGFALDGKPVIYSCYSLVSDRTPAANREHMIMTFEQTIRLMPDNGVDQWIWFADFAGFGLKDCSVGSAKVFLELAQKHYPERLGLFCLVGTPGIFNVLWRAVMPFVDPVTKEKIRILPADYDKPGGNLQAFMKENFTLDCAKWITQEMQENRDAEVLKDKKYCQRSIFEGIKLGSDAHSHWGSSSLLSKLQEQPAHLLPQAQATSTTS